MLDESLLLIYLSTSQSLLQQRIHLAFVQYHIPLHEQLLLQASKSAMDATGFALSFKGDICTIQHVHR